MVSGSGSAFRTSPRPLPARPVAASRRWLGIVALSFLLSSCLDQLPPQLELSPSHQLELSSARSTVTLTNAGGGSLQWEAASDNPLVVLSAMQGRILRGAERTLTLIVDDSDLDVDDLVEATLTFTSNGGNAAVHVSYKVGSGIGQCGSYLAPEIGSTGAAPGGSRAIRAAAPGVGARAVPGEVLVAYTPVAAGLAVGADALRDHLSGAAGMALVRAGSDGAPDLFTATDPDRAIELLLADPRVSYAQRNYYLEPQLVPNDPFYAQQWHLTGFGMPYAWDRYSGQLAQGGSVTIAIIDSGVYGQHPDLASKLLQGWDFYDGDANTSPGAPNGHSEHGTHVAGIAAALGNDAYGVAGVAFGPAIKILPVKVFDAAGVNASIADLVLAIRWSAGLKVPGLPINPNPADVINMSLGVAGVYPALDAAAADAWNAGSLLVAAAGNHTGAMVDPGILSPANSPCVIAVGSVDSDYGVSTFSNTGPQLELVAPGGFSNTGCLKVVSTLPPPITHGCMSGTSMAAPFVAGIAALVIGQGTDTTPASVRDRLNLTALRATWMTDARSYGNGVACADAALGSPSACGYTPAATPAGAPTATAAGWSTPR